MEDWPQYKIPCPWDYGALRRADKRKAIELTLRVATRMVAEWEVKDELIDDALFLVKRWLRGDFERDEAFANMKWAERATEKAEWCKGEPDLWAAEIAGVPAYGALLVARAEADASTQEVGSLEAGWEHWVECVEWNLNDDPDCSRYLNITLQEREQEAADFRELIGGG